jgi:WD40 repeat protein
MLNLPNAVENYGSILKAFSRALRLEAHVLIQHPCLLWQQLYNRLQWEGDSVLKNLEPELHDRSCSGAQPWLKCNTPFGESQELLRTIQTLSYNVFSCAFSPDGDTIFSGDEDGIIRIFQNSSGKQVHAIELNQIAKAYHFSPDGKTIKTICQDGSLLVLEIASGRQLNTFETRSDVELSAFSLDGRLLLTYHKDKALILWNTETGKTVWVSAHPIENVEACSFSHDGRLIATTGGLGHEFCVWSAESGERMYRTDPHYKRSRHTCNFSPDGQLIVTDSAIWEAKSGRLIHLLWGHDDVVSSCVFSPDGRFIASTSWDHTVRIWNVKTGQLYCTFSGHTDWVMACAFSPDGLKVLSAGNDETLRIWNIPSEAMNDVVEANPGSVMSCRYSPDGNLIAAGYGNGKLLLIDGSTGENLHSIDITSNPITACVFSPDSKYVTCAGKDWDLQVRDVKTGGETITFELETDTRTLDCDFSPDGKYLAASDPKGFEVLIWDFNSKEKEICRKFEEHKIVVNTCKFSPDGLWIASGDWNSNLFIWNVSTGKVLHKLLGQTGSVNCCSFSPDGKRIVSGNEDGSVKVWSLENGDLIHSLEAHTNHVSDCAFSPDGSIFICTAEDTYLKVFDANSFELLAHIPFSGKLISLGIHPYEPKLVCGDNHGTLFSVDLMGIDYGPIFVTSAINNGHILARCPACQKEHQVDMSQRGKVLKCDTPACNLRLKINLFTLGRPVAQTHDIATSGDIIWLRDQVRFYQENNDMENVLKATDRILELQCNDPFANHTRISLLLQLGHVDEAYAICNRCIQLGITDKDNPGKTYLLMGMALAANENLGSQRYESALNYFQSALNVEKTSQAWLQLGMAQANLGRPEIALESYMKARSLQSVSEKDQIDLAIGFTYLQMEKAPMAEFEFRNSVSDGNQDPLVCFGLGLSLVLTGKADQSLQWFKKFLQHAKPEHQQYIAQAKLMVDKLDGLHG